MYTSVSDDCMFQAAHAGDRSFPFAEPRTWNDLPERVRQSNEDQNGFIYWFHFQINP